MDAAEPKLDSEALLAARERRMGVKQAVSAVEVAAALPAADPDWKATNLRELRILRSAFDAHVAEVEADDGLLWEVLQDAPRLQRRITELEDEHPGLCAQIDAVIDLTEGEGSVDDVRAASLSALLAIARHRQHGADLVYDAYMVDIGTGG